MTPEETREEAREEALEVLRAAARTIGQVPEADIESKFAQLQEARKARTEREIIRQQAETDSLELDEAAYLVGLKHEESGDLRAAERWYRAAAVNDFPGASLRLASVLNALAAEHHARAETQAEEALIEEAHEWGAMAFGAGEDGASELNEELNARLDPDRPTAQPAAPASPSDPAATQCALGGLRKAALLDQDKMTEHLDSCGPCQAELAEQSAGSASTPASR